MRHLVFLEARGRGITRRLHFTSYEGSAGGRGEFGEVGVLGGWEGGGMNGLWQGPVGQVHLGASNLQPISRHESRGAQLCKLSAPNGMKRRREEAACRAAFSPSETAGAAPCGGCRHLTRSCSTGKRGKRGRQG